MDEDSRMLAYIDKHIVGDRTSNAAEDSAGAAYERGEFNVPGWFSEEYQPERRSNPVEKAPGGSYNYADKSRLTFDGFLNAMGALFLGILAMIFVLFIFGFFAS